MIATGADTLSATEQSFVRTLRRHVPEIVADSLRRRALEALHVREGALQPSDVANLCVALRKSVRLFVDPALQEALLRELETLSGPCAEIATERHVIASERDISLVRVRAREIALDAGGTALGAQRAATATSELARNILSYAERGWMELVPNRSAHAITIRAVDQGPGIRDLEAVLGGRYRSRTGLGRGLLGVKKLATRFDIVTGPTGTRIEAEVAL
jgi:serine/threonine-protein kinase RsbT